MTALVQKDDKFTLRGRRIPRLTEILADLGIVDYEGIPSRDRDYYMDRGSKVHKACELWTRGILREESLDEALVPYLAGWKQAVEELGLAWTHLEERVVNETYWYVTKPDFVGTSEGLPAVVEIKSGKLEWWTAWQLSLQAECFPDGHTFKRIGIELPGKQLKDGKFYRAHHFTDRNDRALALSAVSIYHAKQNKGK